MTLAYIICKDKREAEKISTHLLKKRFIACANMFPIKSIYWWKNKIIKSYEYAMIAKTSSKNFRKVESEIKKIHSYEIQCILKIDASANKEYLAWMNKEIK